MSAPGTPDVSQGAEQDNSGGKAKAIQLIGGLVAVGIGLLALVTVAILGIVFVRSDPSSVSSLASGSFGVIGSIIGAYFGVKVGTDGTKNAIEGLKDESIKAQSFAAQLDPARVPDAVTLYQSLRATSPS